MNPKKFLRLVIWEIEEYWAFPVLELVMFAAILSALNQPLNRLMFKYRYTNLASAFPVLSLFLDLLVGAVVSRTFAGSLSKGEAKRLLSYPVKRWSVLLSKFLTNLLVLFAIYAAAFSLNIPLLALSPLEPMFYVSLMSLLVQLFFLCTIAMALSLAIRGEVVSILASILLFLGIETMARNESYLSFGIRHGVIFRYFEQAFRGMTAEVAFQDVVMALSLPILISISLLAVSFVYFNYIMEID